MLNTEKHENWYHGKVGSYQRIYTSTGIQRARHTRSALCVYRRGLATMGIMGDMSLIKFWMSEKVTHDF